MNPDNSTQRLHLLDALCQSNLDDVWAVDKAYNLFYFNHTFKESARVVFGIELSINLPDTFSEKNFYQIAAQYTAFYEPEEIKITEILY